MEIKFTKNIVNSCSRKLRPGWKVVIEQDVPILNTELEEIPLSFRETKSIWFYIRKNELKKFFQRKMYKSTYFWHDSFAIHFRRAVKCNHDFIFVGDLPEQSLYCCKCEQYADDLYKNNKLNKKQITNYFTKSL